MKPFAMTLMMLSVMLGLPNKQPYYSLLGIIKTMPSIRRPKVVIQTTHPGSLTRLGYSLRGTDHQRHEALKRGVHSPHIGYKSTMAKINTLYVWNKNRNPSLARIAEKDKTWLKKTFGSFAFKSPRRRPSPLRRHPSPLRRRRD